MKLKQIISIMIACMLTGCSAIVLNTDELMQPPSLSNEQTSVMNELKSSLGTDSIKLKYPRFGDYRSAFVFHDLDGDFVEDALVFYEDSDGYTRINIMSKKDEEWTSVYDTPGPQSDVEFVEFAPLIEDDKDNIIIGWNSTNNYGENAIYIYNFEDYKLKKIYDDNYSMYKIVSRKNSKRKELVILTSPQKQASVRLIKGRSGNKMNVIGVSYLNDNISEYVSVTLGNVGDNESALFIDEYLTDGTIATEVISLANSQLDNKMSSNNTTNKFFDATVRTELLFAKDIDNDNIIEIPCQTPLPGYEMYDGEIKYLTNYNALKSRELVTKKSAYVSFKDGYQIGFPDKWIGKVTIKIQPQTGECSFIIYNTNLEKSSVELLRLRIYSKNDYRDKFELEQYKQIATKGIFDYYAYIPISTGNLLEINNNELLTMFSFI